MNRMHHANRANMVNEVHQVCDKVLKKVVLTKMRIHLKCTEWYVCQMIAVKIQPLEIPENCSLTANIENIILKSFLGRKLRRCVF